MQKTIVVCGHGPGISNAVATKFGAEGFQVALAARSADKLKKAQGELEAQGINAVGFPTDLSDPQAARGLVQRVNDRLGAVTVLHWNAYTNAAGDVMAADAAELRQVFDISITSLVSVVQEAFGALKTAKGALLITNGGLGLYDPKIDEMAVQSNAMGLAIGNAAKHKLIGLLRQKLRSDDITVGEVVVVGLVKGTVWDTGNATIEPSTISERFWEMYSRRESKVVTVS
jgi:short-subunit dehydrogenase